MRSLSVVVLAVVLTGIDGQTANGGPSAGFSGMSDRMDFPGSWVSNMFYQALANFTTRNVGSTDCQKQSDLYDRSLQNHTNWAVRMAESWDRLPIGVLGGNRYHMGIYDECVQVNYPVRGKYCLSEIKLIPPKGKDYGYNRTIDKDYFGNNHGWHTVLGWVDFPDQIPRNILNIGICIPASCSAFDLQTSLQKELHRVFNPDQVRAIAKVDPITCTVSGDMYPYNTAHYVTSIFFVLLVLICLSATLQHIIQLSYQQNEKKVREDSYSYFNSFSFIKSGKELLKFDKNNELNSINGFKFLAMLGILFGHRFMYLAGYPMSYPDFVEKIYLYGPDILLTSMNLVDPFFYLSGYLMYLTISPEFMKPGPVWIKLVSPIIYRVVRILPAYCAMILITAHIVPHLGDGPLWPQKIWFEAENCKKYWWTNVLFISNFYDVNDEFFIIGVIILYIYTKNNKLGIGMLITLICISLILPFISTLLTKGDGILKVHLPFLENPRSSKMFNEAYRSSYLRATPFFCGLATALIVKSMQENKYKFSQFDTFIYDTFKSYLMATALFLIVEAPFGNVFRKIFGRG